MFKKINSINIDTSDLVKKKLIITQNLRKLKRKLLITINLIN